MLTGDAVAIARETCKQLGLNTNVYDSEKLIGGGMAGVRLPFLCHTMLIPRAISAISANTPMDSPKSSQSINTKWSIYFKNEGT